MPFMEQMANIGSEVNRALNWQEKNNPDYTRKAIDRALELIDLTLVSIKPYSRIRELTRLREGLVDYFYYSNEFRSLPAIWRNYFNAFAFAVRKQ